MHQVGRGGRDGGDSGTYWHCMDIDHKTATFLDFGPGARRRRLLRGIMGIRCEAAAIFLGDRLSFIQGTVRDAPCNLLSPLLQHHLLLDQHVELHVAVVLASDVHTVDHNVAIAGYSYTVTRRATASQDANTRKDEDENGVGLRDGVVGISDMYLT